jgi:PHD/YefM family antitoxin component YafN of YafNO toxin-antitoxin module
LVIIQTKTLGRTRYEDDAAAEVKTKLSELVDAVERRDEVVTITRNGKTVLFGSA